MAKRKVLPPIEGLPAKAPICPYCGRSLKPWTQDTIERRPVTRTDRWDGSKFTGTENVITSRKFVRWSAYDGVFDRLKCARYFALAAYNAGYRLKPKPKRP